jgi:putative phosphoesterase
MSGIIGVISDTHGLMRPEAIAALQNSTTIIHAGDIGSEAVLRALEKIAPVYAVRGNNDTTEWAAGIPSEMRLTVAGILIHIVHDIAEFHPQPETAVRVVITGHSHRPSIEERDGILYINPGSAGPRRFRLPISVARLDIRDQRPTATLLQLDCATSGSDGKGKRKM